MKLFPSLTRHTREAHPSADKHLQPADTPEYLRAWLSAPDQVEGRLYAGMTLEINTLDNGTLFRARI